MSGAEETVKKIEAIQQQKTNSLIGKAFAYKLDVSNHSEFESLASIIKEEHGGTDILINNAGIGVAARFLDTPLIEFKKVMDVNLWGMIHGSRAFGQQMKERGAGGHIVNITSGLAYQPGMALSAYCTSKAAALMFTECLRADFASYKIRVTAICPGFVNTSIAESTMFVGATTSEQAELRRKTSKFYKLRNYPPERVANIILKAIRWNCALVPVTIEARSGYYTARFFPWAARLFARMNIWGF